MLHLYFLPRLDTLTPNLLMCHQIEHIHVKHLENYFLHNLLEK